MSQLLTVTTFRKKCLKYSWEWKQGLQTLREWFSLKNEPKENNGEIEKWKKLLKKKTSSW